MIYVVIPVFNARNHIEECLGSLAVQTYREFKVVVVDDGSRDGTESLIKERFPETLIVKGTGDWWWTRSMNEGLKAVLALARPGDYMLSLNIDLRVDADYLEKMMIVAAALKPCVVGSVCVDRDHPEKIVFAGVTWNPWTAHYKPVRQPTPLIRAGVEYLPTAMLPGRGALFPIEAFAKTGPYDEGHMPQYAADEDMSLRATKAGFPSIICPQAKVYSHVRSTGINFLVSGETSPAAFWKSLWSVRSPFYLKARLFFALAHGKIGPLYFLFDVGRIVGGFGRFLARQALDGFRRPQAQSSSSQRGA